MRIGINAYLIRDLVSGVEYYIRDLLRALIEFDGTNSYTVYHLQKARSRIFADLRGCNRVATRFIDNPVTRIVWEQVALPLRSSKDGIEILHAPGYIMPLFSTLPTIVTIPDIIALKHPGLCGKRNAAYFKHFLPRSARRACRIIALSHTTKRDLIEHLGIAEDKIDVVHCGVRETFKPITDSALLDGARRKFGITGKVLLFAGNLEPKKNLGRLIAAFHELKGSNALEHQLVIAGHQGVSYGELRATAHRLGMDKSVVFTGYVSSEDLTLLYNIADVFVFPSLYEGFGIPPLEAMSCGTVVVGADAGSIPEVVGDGAVLVNPYAVEDIARGIYQAATDDELRKTLIERGRRRASRFTWRRAAAATVEVYEKCHIRA